MTPTAEAGPGVSSRKQLDGVAGDGVVDCGAAGVDRMGAAVEKTTRRRRRGTEKMKIAAPMAAAGCTIDAGQEAFREAAHVIEKPWVNSRHAMPALVIVRNAVTASPRWHAADSSGVQRLSQQNLGKLLVGVA